MSSRLAAPAGAQTPRVRLVPRAANSDVDDAVFLASAYGLVPDPWQEDVLEGWLGIRADRQWAAPRCGLAVPRQNGKNAIIEVRELHGLVSLGERILHTAHEVKTARKAFTRLLSFFENEREYPELAKLVREIRRTNGQEAVVLENGGSVEFIARSKSSGRGFSVDVLIMDEAQELTDDSLAALLPTISAAANPQQIMAGTPPGPSANGEVFTRLRDAGVKGADRRLCWMEWSVEGDNFSMDDPAVWAQANPALGGRLRHETTADERAAMDDETFARERLGMWEVTVAQAVISARKWGKCADKQDEHGDGGSEAENPLTFAVHMPPDRSWTSIAMAGARADGLAHVELVDRRRGNAWVLERLTELTGRGWGSTVVLDGRGAAATLIPDLERAGIQAISTSAGDMAMACGGFYDAVEQERLRHLDQSEVNEALAAAKKRDLSGAWAWSARNVTVDISPLIAVTLAHFGHTSSSVDAGSGGWMVSL